MKRPGDLTAICALAALAALTACGDLRQREAASGAPDAADAAPDDAAKFRRSVERAAPAAWDGAPFAGLWAQDPADCAVAPGAGVPSAIGLSGDRWVGPYGDCDIESYAPAEKAQSYLVTASCPGDNVRYISRVTMTLDADRLRISASGAEDVVLRLCPAD